MAKASGIGWSACSVDDAAGTPVVIKNDVTNLQFSTPRATQDVTGIDKSAMERLLLLADFSITLNGVFNAAVSHTAWKTIPSTSVARTTSLTVNGTSLNTEVLYTDYPLSRADSGELTWAVPGVLADGQVPTWT
jgi:hypothetical protein